MLFHVTFFSLFTFDPCRGNENKLSHHFRKLLPFFRNICARSRKVTLKIATLKEVNTPRSRKKKLSLSIRKWILFLKYLEFNSFLKFYI